MNLITQQCPRVDRIGNWWRTRLDHEDVMFTKEQPYVQVKNYTRVCVEDLVILMRESAGIPEVASEIREPYLGIVGDEDDGVVKVTWTWYEVTL